MTIAHAYDFHGRTALVTGATRGIGASAAVALAAHGARVIALCRGDGTGTLERIQAAGGDASVVYADLSEPSSVEQVARDLLEQGPVVDILVNNAGTIHRSPSAEVTLGDWQRTIDVNLTSAWTLSRLLGAAMAARGSGKIVTMASLLSFQGGLEVAGYAASKHAVVGMTQALCNEWASSGVQVNALAPGYIVTDNTSPLRADASRMSEITRRIPSGRWGPPDDLLGALLFLASSASDYVNGHTLVVDGGWMAR